MMTESCVNAPIQRELFRTPLAELVDNGHEMVKLADAIDCKSFEAGLASTFCADNGRPSIPVRTMVALHFLKYTYDMSDAEVLSMWVENPYWQYFTGGTFFEHEPPADQSSMSRWRKRLHKSGAEAMLVESIKVGLRKGFIKKSEFKHITVDTTVQEKNIRFPTDARLYDRCRERIVAEARKANVVLRQTFARKGKQCLRKHGGYAKARQMERAEKMTRMLKSCLGRVIRDVERKIDVSSHPVIAQLIAQGRRLLAQTRQSTQKLYSIHEPQVECISKGKMHKQYEFGVKVGIASTSRTNWIVGADAYPGNPYDGHTLQAALDQVKRLIGIEPDMTLCDLGYRGNGYAGKSDIQVVNRFRTTRKRSLVRWWNRRSAVEPVIGHLKSEHRLDRNRLGGTLGDELNPVFAAAGFNLRKLLRAFALLLSLFVSSIFCNVCTASQKRVFYRLAFS
jgi:transposase, IS5 family